MSAKAHDSTNPGGLDETVDYLKGQSAYEPAERDRDMPRTPPGGQNRYTFGSGARPLEGYTIKRAVGRGGFGEVYYATSDSGKEVALKLITRNLEIERRGVAQCMNLKSPNLLAIHDIKTNDEGDTFVIMEFVAGPSLANVLARYPNGMPLDEVRGWLKGLVEGVAYLHDHGVVHRDLKPANLFMEEGIVKIGDYGLAKMITSERISHHSESIGTCHYMAPEISTGKYHKPIDVYSIGVILFEMITGRVPFEGETVGEVLIKHLTTRPDLSKLPEPFKGIVAKALAKDPAHRPTRVYDLLPPGDAPRPRDVHFIGNPGDRLAAPAPSPRPRPVDDGIFRITDEEPILYIGPETRPPKGGRLSPFNPWARRSPRPGPAAPTAQARRPPKPSPTPRGEAADLAARAAHRVRLIASAPMLVPEPPPQPQPLPPARLRVAELAASMLWAAPWTVLATMMAGGLLQLDLARRPQDLAFLGTMTLLSSWTVLAAHKVAEGREDSPTAGRLLQLALVVILALIGRALAGWMMVEPAPNPAWASFPGFVEAMDPANLATVLGYAGTLALIGLGIDWGSMADRGRKARFRLAPVAKAALIGLVPGLILIGPGHAHLLTLPAAALASVVVQLASPWSEAAARYARYARYSGSKKSGARTA